jgi:hypothetical protein
VVVLWNNCDAPGGRERRENRFDEMVLNTLSTVRTGDVECRKEEREAQRQGETQSVEGKLEAEDSLGGVRGQTGQPE